jgi:hypothetical protein
MILCDCWFGRRDLCGRDGSYIVVCYSVANRAADSLLGYGIDVKMGNRTIGTFDRSS